MFRQAPTKITEQTQGAFRLSVEHMPMFYSIEREIYSIVERYKAFDIDDKIKTIAILSSVLKQDTEPLLRSLEKINIPELLDTLEQLQRLAIHQLNIQQVPQLNQEEIIDPKLESLEALLETNDLRFLFLAILRSSYSLLTSDQYEGKTDLETLARIFPIKEKRTELKRFFSYLSKML